MNRRHMIPILFALLAAAASAGFAGWDDCDGYEKRGSWGPKGRYCEIRELEFPAEKSLGVDAGKNGGIRVSGERRDDIAVQARIEVWNAVEVEAVEIAEAVEIRYRDSRLVADGQDSGWSVSYRIRTPHEIDLDLSAHNGGIAVEEVTGRLRAETVNGGIGLVALAGDAHARTQNGGLHVELTGDTWRGAGLDAVTRNGGVDVDIPADYSAEFETGTVNGRVRIDFPVTVEGRIGDEIRTTLGEGGPPVSVRTTNGSVTVTRFDVTVSRR